MPYDAGDKSTHKPECRCILCLDFKRICCGRTYTTYQTFMRHTKNKAHGVGGRTKSPKRRTQIVIVPDGLGSLISTTSTPERLQTISLQAISRFAAALNDQRHFRSQKFSRRERDILKQLQRLDNELGDLSVQIPLVPDQALAVYQLAQAANIPTKAVASLLVSYGLEHLARELRTQSAAPTPKAPRTVVRERRQPNTPHEEFLEENGVTVPKRKREYYEYHKRPIPQAEQDGPQDSPRPPTVPPVHGLSPDGGGVQQPVQDSRRSGNDSPIPPSGPNAKRYIPRN